MIIRYIIINLFIILLLISCQSNNETNDSSKYTVVVTTNIIENTILNIVDTNYVNVFPLMKEGVDPHLYKATRKDLELLNQADIIFYNGLHLEGKLAEVLDKLSRQKKVVALADVLDKEKLIQVGEGIYDPHIWFDVVLWKEVTQYARNTLNENNIPTSKKNYISYLDQLDSTNNWINKRITNFPSKKRILITSHDAFSYLGRAYGIEVNALLGISTVAEYGIKDINNLVDYIIENKVRSIFAETSVSSKSLEAIVAACQTRGHEVQLVSGLYSDALGKKDTKEGTYIGMLESNINKIVNSLN
ncbi:MAG: metal ABC transporter solute-binding protein, Zn/Mn family [Thermonemataceae bacterium]|mgnify:CR=1 FL=1